MKTPKGGTGIPFGDWSQLRGLRVEMSLLGETVRRGFVDDVMPDSSLIWLAPEGVYGRELFDAAFGYEIRLESDLISPLQRATQKIAQEGSELR